MIHLIGVSAYQVWSLYGYFTNPYGIWLASPENSTNIWKLVCVADFISIFYVRRFTDKVALGFIVFLFILRIGVAGGELPNMPNAISFYTIMLQLTMLRRYFFQQQMFHKAKFMTIVCLFVSVFRFCTDWKYILLQYYFKVEYNLFFRRSCIKFGCLGLQKWVTE